MSSCVFNLQNTKQVKQSNDNWFNVYIMLYEPDIFPIYFGLELFTYNGHLKTLNRFLKTTH